MVEGLGHFLGGVAAGREQRLQREQEGQVAERRLDLAQQGLGIDRLRLEQQRRQQLREQIAALDTESRQSITSLFALVEKARDAAKTPQQFEDVGRMAGIMRQSAKRMNERRQGLGLAPVDIEALTAGSIGIAPDPMGEARQTGRAKVAESRAIADAANVPAQQVFEAQRLVPEQDGDDPFGGTGFKAQSANVLAKLSGKLSRGEVLTDGDKRAYALAYSEITSPRIVGDPASGYRVVQPVVDSSLFPSPDSIGVQGQAQPAPSRPPSASIRELDSNLRQTPERAGRTSMVQQGAELSRNVRDALIDPTGRIDRSLVFTMATDIPLLGKGIPGTEGRSLRAQFEDVAAAKLRLETGAAATPAEIENILDRYMPSMLDSDATIRDKLGRLTEFFSTSLRRTDPDLHAELLERAGEQGNIPEPPEGESGASFEGFDASSGVAVFKRPDGSFFGVPQ